MVTKEELVELVEVLSDRVQRLEDDRFRVEEVLGVDADERFDDLLAAVLAALVRSRSQGAMLTAKALADKYLPEGTDIQSYGEAFVTSSGLYSSGKKEG